MFTPPPEPAQPDLGASPAPGVDAALLLEQADWIRALAGKLVDDPHSADDLVQDTWVAALRSSERPRSPRGFLATILRNLVRDRRATDSHRDARERGAARPEAQPSADELVAELQMQRKVAAIVGELPEPLRTPLLLRYWRSLGLEEIARHQGVAASTVHDRLQRGIDELRRRLDEAHGGDRRAWAGVLLPLCGPPGAAATTIPEVLAVSSTHKIAALFAAAVTGLCGLWWFVDDVREVEDEVPVAHSAPAAVRAPTGAEPAGAPVDEERVALTAAAPTAVDEVPAVVLPATFEGRVVDLEGAPVAGLPLGFGDAPTATSGVEGHFELPRPETEQDRVFAQDQRWKTVVPGVPPTSDEPDRRALVVVAERQTIAGWVSDEAGTPLPNVELTVHVSNSLFRDLGLLRHWSTETPTVTVTTDENGAFELADVAGSPHLRLTAAPGGFDLYNELLPEGDVRDLHVVLHRTSGPELLFGTVVDPDGLPVEDALVSWIGRVVRTDAEGRFRIAKPESSPDFLQASGRATDFSPLRALKAGHLPAEIPSDLLPPSPVELVLGPEPLSISGHIVDELGNPRRGVVWVLDEAPYGHILEQSGADEMSVSYGVMTESLLRGGRDRGGDRGVWADEDGRFELGGLLDRFYRLHAYDPETLAEIEPLEIRAGTHRIEIVLPAGDVAPVAGRLRSLSGQPLVGVRVQPRRTFDGQMAPWGDWPSSGATTDDEGRFAFPGLTIAETRLTYHSELVNFFEGHALEELATEQALDDLEIELPRVARLQVDATHREPSFADHFAVLDADGNELEVALFHENMMYLSPRGPVREGKSSVVQTDERAKTVVLYQAGVEVARATIELVGDGLTTVRP